jgi:hypothetical protein
MKDMNSHNYPEALPKPLRIAKRVAKITAVALICLGLAFALPSGAFFPVILFAFLLTPIGWVAALAIVIFAALKGYETYRSSSSEFFNFSITPVQSVMIFITVILLIGATFILR